MFESRKRVPPGELIEFDPEDQTDVLVLSPMDDRRLGMGKVVGRLCHERSNLIIRLKAEDSPTGAVDLLDSECTYLELTDGEMALITRNHNPETVNPQEWADFLDKRYLSPFS